MPLGRARALRIPLGIVIVSALLFWALRILYWTQNSEPPFSDIWGYVVTGDNIARHFFFGTDPTHPTYYTPITPSLIAIAKLIGGERFEWAFRFIVQAITFSGAVALMREITLVTGKRWLGAAFLFILAMSRPSIFWSLKLATEPVCEAFLYATAAAALAALRTRALSWAAICGVLALCLGLNRPNFIPGALFIPLALLVGGGLLHLAQTRNARTPGNESRDRWRPFSAFLKPDARSLLLIGVFCLGFFGTWSIWIGRNLLNYGVFVPTSSSGAQSVTWEFSGRPIKVGRYESLTLADGSEYAQFEDVTHLAGRFPLDFEGAQKLNMIARAWYAANYRDLPRLFIWRLKNLVGTRGVSGLSQLSREAIFVAPTPGYNNPYPPTSWINLLLLDKTPTVCLIALVGVGFFVWMNVGAGLIMAGLALMPWLAAAAVIGYERMVESLIPITIWLALFGISQTVTMLNGKEIAPQT